MTSIADANLCEDLKTLLINENNIPIKSEDIEFPKKGLTLNVIENFISHCGGKINFIDNTTSDVNDI